MGQLKFPLRSKVYLDTAPIIYSVEKHADYWKSIAPFWQSLSEGKVQAFTSELTLVETLVQPLKHGNQTLIQAYQTLLTQTEIITIPISPAVLTEAAGLRANENLKTPDAIHAASARLTQCQYIVTNDEAFKRLANINVIILSEVI